MRSDTGQRLLSGAAAGLVATVPMTAAMVAMHRQLPAHERHPLPPRHITVRAAGKAGARKSLDETDRTAATLVAHFGYGTAVGSVLGALAPRGAAKAAAAGAGFGLVVWAVSYLGLMPGAGLYPPATRDATRRNLLMVAAHLVWGATAGVLVHALRSR